ncbi:MAG: peptide deformylase [Cytophagales bacterium]|nr:peptide deformylase [Cytophagales bacterium]
MALLNILTYPDPRLHKVAKPVAQIDERIRTLAADMIETMYESSGVGLAATQVDVHERLLVMDVSEERDQPLVVINPRVVWQSNEVVVGDEGCLSVPGFSGDVERYAQIHIEFENERGDTHKLEAEGLLAVCVQHEMDHLIGKVYVEYLSPLKRGRIKTKLLKEAKEALREAS